MSDQQAEAGQQAKHNTSEKVILGRISGVYGVKGWVKIYSYTDPMESIVEYSPWYLRPESRYKNDDTEWTKIKLKSGKRHAKTVVAKLEHCNDRDQAQALVGMQIAIEASQLETLQGEDEFYWRDLVGLTVINQQDVELGQVKSLMETGANDVLVVFSNTEQRERLIPWTLGIAVTSVDLDNGVITVDWPVEWDVEF